MASSTRATLSNAGDAVSLNLLPPCSYLDNNYACCVSAGGWTGLTLQVEGSTDGGTSWASVGPPVSPSDGALTKFHGEVNDLYNKIRARVTALTAGPVAVQIESWNATPTVKPFTTTTFSGPGMMG